MFKKILSAAVALAMVCSLPSIGAFAASSFSDVISPDYDWAMDEIEEMTTIGIIKGYPDATFRPANSVNNIEALIFMARATGISRPEYAPFAELALEEYASDLAAYDLGNYESYKRDAAFLLYKGIITPKELDSYLADPSAPLKRYEAAVLITKLMGAEDAVKNMAAVVLDYSDYSEIPTDARAYVEYVTQTGLMKGMEDNCFAPYKEVTRVQIAILLNRILKTLDQSVVAGVVSDVDAEVSSVGLYDPEDDKTTTYPIDMETVTLRGFGKKVSSLDDIEKDSQALIVYRGSDIISLELINVAAEEPEVEEYSGIIDDITTERSFTGITVIDEDTDESHEFVIPAKADVHVTIEGEAAKLRDIKKGDFVTVIVVDGDVTDIDVRSGEEALAGVVKAIEIDPEYILTAEIDGDDTDFIVSPDAAIIRNGKEADFEDIKAGDNIVITVKNEVVIEIAAENTTASVSGSIVSIYISSESQLGIKSDGDEAIYDLSPSATYVLSGKSSSIYELRLGAKVQADIENDKIVSVTSLNSTATTQITGVIDAVDSNRGLITVDADGELEQIYVTRGGNTATIIDTATGKTISASKLKKDMEVSVVGNYENGELVAKTIMIIPAE